MTLWKLIVSMALVSLSAGASKGAEKIDFEPAKKHFAELVAAELAREVIPGVSVAWIVDGQVVHLAGYGHADRERGVPATPETIYRAGSISKLFNAVAAMQWVEQEQLDLDAPIERAVPDFRIQDPFAPSIPITIRQLLCHRSGLIREAPVGGYLDDSQSSIADTVASVANAALVNPPNTKMRYSNVGPTVVGRAVELRAGLAYPEYQRRHVLEPLGMVSSAWVMNDILRPELAKGLMRMAKGDGSYFYENAPEFELGTIPAGNLYTTAGDLAKFAIFMMGGGSTDPAKQILKPETLASMYVPQLTGEGTGFGLGFSVNRYRDHKTAQHNGAVYGFSTSLVVLTEAKIGVIVLANADIASAGVKRLTEAGLDLLLEKVRGQTLPQPMATVPADPAILKAIAGDYESTSYWAKLEVENGSLRCTLSGQPLELKATAPLKFVADGRMMAASPFDFVRGEDGQIRTFTAAGQKFERVDPAKVEEAPPAWKKFVGSYGPRFIPLVVSIRHGHLYGTVENEYDYRLTPVNRVTFNLAPGMYSDEEVIFQIDRDGTPIGAIMANQYLPRRVDQ